MRVETNQMQQQHFKVNERYKDLENKYVKMSNDLRVKQDENDKLKMNIISDKAIEAICASRENLNFMRKEDERPHCRKKAKKIDFNQPQQIYHKTSNEWSRSNDKSMEMKTISYRKKYPTKQNEINLFDETRDEISDSVVIIGRNEEVKMRMYANLEYVSIGPQRFYYRDIVKLSSCHDSNTKWMILTNDCTIRIRSQSGKSRYNLMAFIQSNLWFFFGKY